MIYDKSNLFMSLSVYVFGHSLYNHLYLTGVTAVPEIFYFQANILLTGLICSLSKLKWPHVNTLIGLEGIKHVHMQFNCP